MKEHQYIENFDKVLRYYVRPLMLEAISKISEANLEVFDLVNEYCEDNNLEYVGEKPKRSKYDKPVLCNLKLEQQLTDEKIQEIAKTEKSSEERKELTKKLMDGMDVQAALKLLGYRWFEPKAVDHSNTKKIADILGLDKETLQVIKSTLFSMISTRNKGGAHFSNNSHMSEDEYNGKMLHVSSVFWDLKHLDYELFQEYTKFCEVGTSDEIEVEELEVSNKKKKQKMIIGFIGAAIVLIGILAFFIIDNIYSLDNDSEYVPNKSVLQIEYGEIQIKPCKIYCENDQLHLELMIGNGTTEEIREITFDFILQNRAGDEIVSGKKMEFCFSKPIPSNGAKKIKIIYEANQVNNKDSDLSRIQWWAEGHVE